MLKVFSGVKGILVPEFQADFVEHMRLEQEYAKAVVDYCRIHGRGDLAGEVVNFPVADGYAQYVVHDTSPCTLVHLAVGDAWDFPYIERLTAKDVRHKVEQAKAFEELWSGNRT